jgi:hypothetical protein
LKNEVQLLQPAMSTMNAPDKAAFSALINTIDGGSFGASSAQ